MSWTFINDPHLKNQNNPHTGAEPGRQANVKKETKTVNVKKPFLSVYYLQILRKESCVTLQVSKRNMRRKLVSKAKNRFIKRQNPNISIYEQKVVRITEPQRSFGFHTKIK